MHTYYNIRTLLLLLLLHPSTHNFRFRSDDRSLTPLVDLNLKSPELDTAAFVFSIITRKGPQLLVSSSDGSIWRVFLEKKTATQVFQFANASGAPLLLACIDSDNVLAFDTATIGNKTTSTLSLLIPNND